MGNHQLDPEGLVESNFRDLRADLEVVCMASCKLYCQLLVVQGKERSTEGVLVLPHVASERHHEQVCASHNQMDEVSMANMTSMLDTCV